MIPNTRKKIRTTSITTIMPTISEELRILSGLLSTLWTASVKAYLIPRPTGAHVLHQITWKGAHKMCIDRERRVPRIR